MKKRILSILLTIVMVIGMLPTVAFAAATTPDIWVGGIGMNSGDYLAEGASAAVSKTPAASDDNYAYYKDGVLTLHNYTYTGDGYDFGGDYACVYTKNDLKLVLEGANSLTGPDDKYSNAVFVDGTLTIEGTKLTASARQGIVAEGDLTINSGEIIVMASDYKGIYADGDVSIEDSKLDITAGYDGISLDKGITITGSELDITAGGVGIYVYEGDATITDSELDITAGGDGIYASEGDATITDSELDITAGGDGIYASEGAVAIEGSELDISAVSYGGITADTDITITDSELDISAVSYGIYVSEGAVAIEDSKLDITAVGYGIYVYEGAVTINDGTVTIRSTDTELDDSYCWALAADTITIADTLTAQASTEPDGSNPETYDSAKNDTYDWVKIEPAAGTEPEKTAAPTISYDDETLTVTATGDGTVILYVDGVEVENPYTFEQGNEAATYTVTATAQEEGKEVSETVTKSVTVPAVQPTEYDITVTGGTASANKAVAGTEITLTVDESAIPAGQVFDKWEVVSGGVTITDGKFTMPESAVEINATYKDAPVVTETPVISYEVTDNAVIITATGKGEVKLYADGDDEPVNNPYIIPRGETEITVTFTATAKEEGKEISETATKSVTVPAVQPTEYDITVTGGTASANKAVEGTSVTITANAASAGKVFDKWVIDGIIVEDPTATTITFTMPANDVSAEATYKDQIFIVNKIVTFDYNDGTGNTEIFVVAQGDTVAKPADPTRSGYTFKGWYLNGTKYDFTAPVTETITLTAKWDKNSTGGGYVTTYYDITVEDAAHGEVSSSRKTASSGTTVTLTVEADKGYTLETLTVTNKKGDEIALTNKGNGEYTFKMPASDVTVETTFMEDNTMLNYFVDVPADAYYYDAVLWAVENEITNGTDAVHFSPDMTCTRAQAVTFLWRAAGSPEPETDVMPFEDVTAGSYYYDAVLWAVENGITIGTSATTFSPDADCTRAQIVTFLWRAQKSPAADAVNPFTDVAADAYYVDAVLWAVKEEVTNGTSATTFSPDADCTRAQIVTFLYRALNEQ